MAKNKHLKRKPTPFIKEKQKEIAPVKDDEESASDQEVNICMHNEFISFLSSRFDLFMFATF